MRQTTSFCITIPDAFTHFIPYIGKHHIQVVGKNNFKLIAFKAISNYHNFHFGKIISSAKLNEVSKSFPSNKNTLNNPCATS